MPRSLSREWIKAKPICPSKSCHIALDKTALLCGNAVLSRDYAKTYRAGCSSSPLNRHDGRPLCLFSSLRIALTSHPTKLNSAIFPERIGRKSLKLRCIWGMLIYLETEPGDVLIKDSISQRSVGCNRTLPLTDGVYQTSAPSPVARVEHLPEIERSSPSRGRTQPLFLNSCVALSDWTGTLSNMCPSWTAAFFSPRPLLHCCGRYRRAFMSLEPLTDWSHFHALHQTEARGIVIPLIAVVTEKSLRSPRIGFFSSVIQIPVCTFSLRIQFKSKFESDSKSEANGH